jgi:spore coat polysaccharide biosynthesis predicted glycosyltransferase SpsG
MKSRILFRADANDSIGTGDLLSFVYFSQYLNSEAWEFYFLARESKAARNIADSYSLHDCIYFIAEDSTISHEVDAINQLVNEKEVSHLFFQINLYDLAEYKGLTHEPYISVVCGNGTLIDKTDLVLSWAVDAVEFYKPYKSGVEYFLGPEYVFLPRRFNQPFAQRQNTKISKVLVSMGGVDEFHLTEKVIEKLIESGEELHLTIISGFGNHRCSNIKSMLEASGLDYCLKSNVKDMLKEFLSCDAAIANGGLTASELVSSKTPCLLVGAYPHEAERCKYFHENQWAVYLGDKDEFSLSVCDFERLSELKQNTFHNRIDEVLKTLRGGE